MNQGIFETVGDLRTGETVATADATGTIVPYFWHDENGKELLDEGVLIEIL